VQILSYRPAQEGGSAIARVDVEFDGIRLNNLLLKQTKSGLRVFGPNVFGRAAVSFTPEAAAALIGAIRGASAHGGR
jgi:hypothetical protein